MIIRNLLEAEVEILEAVSFYQERAGGVILNEVFWILDLYYFEHL